MKVIGKELWYLVTWLAAGCLLVPPLLWWLVGKGIMILPAMEGATVPATYRYFASHLHEPLLLVAVYIPYLIFFAVRLLKGKLSAAESVAPGQAVPRAVPETGEHLVEQCGDPSQDSAAGETPLHLAATRGDVRMTVLLLEGGADLNAVARAAGYSPLQIAALQGHSEVCEVLIRYGANVDAVTSRNETALHLAARAGHTAAVAVLLKYRANAGILNGTGQTAQQLAESLGHDGVVRLMAQHASNEWAYLRLSNG